MFDLRLHPVEFLTGPHHAGIGVGATPRADQGDLAGDRADGGDLRHRHDLVDLGIKSVDSDGVLVRKQLGTGDGGGLADLDLLSGHGAGAVDDEGEGRGLELLLIGSLEFHRQDFLDRGAVITSDAERTHPADHDKSAAELLDVVADRGHAGFADAVSGDVR